MRTERPTPRADRRRRRSQVPDEALRRYLESLADAHGIDALVLAGADGRVVGTSRRGHDVARLGAASVACTRGDAEAFDRLEAIAGSDDLYAHAWSDDGAVFQLVSIRARVPRVADVVRTLRRIRSAA